MVSIVSAFSFFLNIYVKVFHGVDVYTEFSKVFYYLAIVFMVGISGYDQILIKESTVSHDVGVSINNVKEVFCFSVISIFALLIFYEKTIYINNDAFYIVFMTIAGVLLYILSVIFKLKSNPVMQSISLNGWKFISFFIFLFYAQINLSIVQIFSLSMLLTLLALTFYLVKNGRISWRWTALNTVDASNILTKLAASLIMLASFVLFENFERVLFIKLYGDKIFSDYFFIYNIFIIPASIMVGYYSVKNIKSIKNADFNLADFKKLLIMSVYIGIFGVIGSSLMIFIICVFGYAELSDFRRFLMPLAVLTIIKSVYVTISLAFISVVDVKKIMIVAINMCLVSLIVLCCVGYYGKYFFSEFDVVVIAVVLWLYRALSYYLVLKRGLSLR